jgi:hypothetical protein
MLRYKMLVGTMIAGLSASAVAAEPLPLTDQELDRVSAGDIAGSLALSGPSFAVGNLSTLSILNFAAFQQAITIDGSGFSNTTQTMGLSQVSAASSGFGFGASQASAGAYSLIAR